MIEELRTPAPPDVQVDQNLVKAMLGQAIEADAPVLVGAMRRNAIIWAMTPFDSEGWATVRVLWRDTRQPIDGVGMECHWSAVAR
jgi:hypothetical protein